MYYDSPPHTHSPMDENIFGSLFTLSQKKRKKDTKEEQFDNSTQNRKRAKTNLSIASNDQTIPKKSKIKLKTENKKSTKECKFIS
jgi:hypothetical protein